MLLFQREMLTPSKRKLPSTWFQKPRVREFLEFLSQWPLKANLTKKWSLYTALSTNCNGSNSASSREEAFTGFECFGCGGARRVCAAKYFVGRRTHRSAWMYGRMDAEIDA